MAFIPVPNVAQVQMCYLWDGQQVENVYNFEFSIDPSSTVLVDLASGVYDWWNDNMRESAPANFVLQKIIVTDLTSSSSPAIEYGIGLPLAGTSVAEVMPANVTIAVKWTTGLRGRSYRGRTYHMPITRSWVTNSTIGDAEAAGLVASYTLLLDVNAGEVLCQMVVVSRYHNKTARSSGVTTEITGVSIDLTLDSQRRRLPGRGA